MSVHTVLLADESTTTRRIVELSFPEPDVQVVAVSDGDEAIARLAQDPPDLVLADIALPKRSGYDVAAYVSTRQQLSHIPVVLLAGALDIVDELAIRRSGCRSVIRKPFDPKQLSTRIRNLLTGVADPDLDECLHQINAAFQDLSSRRVEEPAAAALGVADETTSIIVDASKVPTLEELLGEIDHSTEVFSLDAVPAADILPVAVEDGPEVEAPLSGPPIVDLTALAVPLDDQTSMDAMVELVTDRVMKRLTEELRMAADAVAAHLVAEAAAPIIREELTKLRQES
jgi:CheY-like chemotaxis protein